METREKTHYILVDFSSPFFTPLGTGSHGAFIGKKESVMCILQPSGNSLNVMYSLRGTRYTTATCKIPSDKTPVRRVWRTPIGDQSIILLWESGTNSLFYGRVKVSKKGAATTAGTTGSAKQKVTSTKFVVEPELVVYSHGPRDSFKLQPHETVIQVNPEPRFSFGIEDFFYEAQIRSVFFFLTFFCR